MNGIGDVCECNGTTQRLPGLIINTGSPYTLFPWGFVFTISSGTMVTINAHTDQAGSSLVYQWKKNLNPVGTNSPTYTTNDLMNGDVITCSLTTGVLCSFAGPGPFTANSNAALFNVLTLSSEEFVKDEFTIYPNPTKDKIYFKDLKNISKVSIYDTTGKLLKSEIPKNNSVDVSTLNSGNYFLEIISGGKTTKSKFIKN